MLAIDLYCAERLMHMSVKETLGRAEYWRLARQARLESRGRLYHQVCVLLCQLGDLLVALGQRLQQRGGAGSVSVEHAEVLGHE